MLGFIKFILGLFGAVVLMLMLAIFLPLDTAPLVGIKRDYAIHHINIVDTVSGEISADMTVLVKQGRIEEVLPSPQYKSLDSYFDIEGSGKYLLPGLWDMHTHGLKLSPQLHHGLFIRHGVTSVRDMSGCLIEDDNYWACPEDRRRWQEAALNGQAVSPRYVLQSSYQTNGGNEVPVDYPTFFSIANQADADKLVDFYSSQDVDFIKTYSELSADQYAYLVTATAQGDMSLAGHKPVSVSLQQVLFAGMDSIEHGRLFMFECFDDIETFRALDNPIAHYNAQYMRGILQNQDWVKCETLMGAMAKSDTHWVPTLTTLKMSAMARDRLFRLDDRLQYIPMVIQKLLWLPDINRAAEKGDDEQGQFVHGDYFSAASVQVGLAKRLGVKILAGTDNIDTFVFTGSSLHDELFMLVEAGLTPLEAIQAATIDAAKFSDLEAEFGSVTVGKYADLILLNANPLEDIGHTTEIFAVMFDGQYFDAPALAALDKFALEMAASIRVNLRYLYDLFSSPLMRVQIAD